jgi:succinate-semialdehyde dehydrogenase/glutarate-semialdehyde dehydrogenase
VGNPFNAETEMGPMVSFESRDQLHRQVQESIHKGARIQFGGKIPHRKGPYYPPTLLTDIRPGMPVFDEETFGPVAPITTVNDIEDAIELANRSEYGLGAAVFTRDRDAAIYVGENVTCGSFAINKMLETDFRYPFGGTKASGYGRELGRSGFLESCYLRTEYYPWPMGPKDTEKT